MTKASAARLERRRRGRPPRDHGYDPDLEVAEWAIALRAARGMSERAALDLALAVCQGAPDTPAKTLRAARVGMLVGGYRLPLGRSFHGRNAAIRQKLKAGKLRPHPAMVLHIVRVLYRMREMGV